MIGMNGWNVTGLLIGKLRPEALDRNMKPNSSHYLYRFAIDLFFIISKSKSVNIGLDWLFDRKWTTTGLVD